MRTLANMARNFEEQDILPRSEDIQNRFSELQNYYGITTSQLTEQKNTRKEQIEKRRKGFSTFAVPIKEAFAVILLISLLMRTDYFLPVEQQKTANKLLGVLLLFCCISMFGAKRQIQYPTALTDLNLPLDADLLNAAKTSVNIPGELTCPISHELMTYPCYVERLQDDGKTWKKVGGVCDWFSLKVHWNYQHCRRLPCAIFGTQSFLNPETDRIVLDKKLTERIDEYRQSLLQASNTLQSK